jgi:hypothetical protein
MAIKRFQVWRGEEVLAEGAMWSDGACSVRHDRSTGMYDSFDAVRSYWERDGVRIGWVDEDVLGSGGWFERGRRDAVQDRLDGKPFASVGGLGARTSMQTPPYVPAERAREYVRGYAHQAWLTYGDKWKTWKPREP